MLAVVMIVVMVSMCMVLLRALLGSTVFDRMLAANSMSTHVVILILMLGLFNDTVFFIDITLIYALISFVSTVGFLIYFKNKKED